ncbi:hypothetical protein KEM54_006924 [Ascosphaera aggregata]|nr:hypothetical protein KEM54_006924 [Ascosphaera aggregata]
MATPSASSIRLLSVFSRKTVHKLYMPRRSLHITGVKSAQPAKGVDTVALYSSKSTSELKSECERRGLFAAGSDLELAQRLASDDQLQARAFSIRMKRIEHGNPFKTTRASIVNFRFMSNLESGDSPKRNMRIPVFPDTPSDQPDAESGEESMSQGIYTVAGRANEVASPSVTIDQFSDPFDRETAQERITSVSFTEGNISDGRVSSIARDSWSGITGTPTAPNLHDVPQNANSSCGTESKSLKREEPLDAHEKAHQLRIQTWQHQTLVKGSQLAGTATQRLRNRRLFIQLQLRTVQMYLPLCQYTKGFREIDHGFGKDLPVALNYFGIPDHLVDVISKRLPTPDQTLKVSSHTVRLLAFTTQFKREPAVYTKRPSLHLRRSIQNREAIRQTFLEFVGQAIPIMYALEWVLYGILVSPVHAFLPLKRSELLFADENAHIRSSYNPDGSVIKYGLKKVKRSRQELPSSVKADKTTLPGSVPLDNDGSDTSYIIEARIGPDMQKVRLLLDSGAPDTWVMSSACQSRACKQRDTIDSNSPSEGPFRVTYGTGKVAGDYINNTITVGDMSVKFEHGFATSASDEFLGFPIDGILGIGYAKADQHPPSLMQSVVAAKSLKQNVIGINLFRHDEEKDGEVIFGGIDKSRIDGNLTYISIVDNAGDWRIPIEGFAVNGNPVKFDKHVAIIDTGTSYVLLPEKDNAKLHSSIKGSKEVGDIHLQNTYIVPCDTKDQVQIIFSGTNFTISPKDYVGAQTAPNSANCYSNIVTQNVWGDGVWLVGDVLLKNLYTVFDWDENRIGKDLCSDRASGESHLTSLTGMANRRYDPPATTLAKEPEATTEGTPSSITTEQAPASTITSPPPSSTSGSLETFQADSHESIATGLQPASYLLAAVWASILLWII